MFGMPGAGGRPCTPLEYPESEPESQSLGECYQLIPLRSMILSMLVAA